jgi:hypothetical protein
MPRPIYLSPANADAFMPRARDNRVTLEAREHDPPVCLTVGYFASRAALAGPSRAQTRMPEPNRLLAWLSRIP